LPEAGNDWFVTVTTRESPLAPAIAEAVMVTEAVSPAAIVDEFADSVNVSELAVKAPDDGPVENTPSPSVATTTSARRLKVSFDIFFLSIVVNKTFLITADKDNVSIS